MSGFYLEPAANGRIDEIYRYSEDRWGETQAVAYVRDMFEVFGMIAARKVPWRPIPATFAVDGYFVRYGRHFIYWKQRRDEIGIVAILHERMDQAARLHDALNLP